MADGLDNRSDRRLMGMAWAGVILILIAGVVLTAYNEAVTRRLILRNLQVQADILAASVSAPLAFDDEAAMREYLRAFSANRELSAAGVYDVNGQLSVSFVRPGETPPPRRLDPTPFALRQGGAAVVAAPVVERGARLGAVYLRNRQEPVARTFRRHGAVSLMVVMAALMLAALARAGGELQRRAAALAAANESLRREMIERERAEVALRQSQKMESLGQLTGGVAHDFNNLLTVILGGLETIGRHLPEGLDEARAARLRRAREMAVQGAERAAILTGRLLAFARRQPLAPARIDLHRMIGGLLDLLRSTLGETVRIETDLDEGVWPVQADPNQLENAILNLAVNARDAMPGGGVLTVRATNSRLSAAEASASPEAVGAGPYVLISVADTGVGMDTATLDKVFEPFFTTKEVGKGTGLGLSQVYGFVRQSGGYIHIDSAPGSGATVNIYLPALIDAAEPAAEARASPKLERITGDEAILVVEDHDDLRAHSSAILGELGYRVFAAADGDEALRLLEARPEVSLLFTDVVLPGDMNGRQLADEALRRRPDLKLLFTTGYTRDAIVRDGELDPGVQLISKPFTFDDLAAKVRRVLDAA